MLRPPLTRSEGRVVSNVTCKTWRARRSLIERLRGVERAYETELSDGFRSVRGRGPSKEASMAEAQRRWLSEMMNENGGSG